MATMFKQELLVAVAPRVLMRKQSVERESSAHLLQREEDVRLEHADDPVVAGEDRLAPCRVG